MKPPTFDPKNIEFKIIDRPDHPDFDKVYDLYKVCYPLPTEQESKENFLAILAENGDRSKPGKEMWVYAQDKTTGEVIGASNFDIFKAAPGHGVDGTALAIYTFVKQEHRQQGMFQQLLDQMDKAAGEFLRSQDPSLPAEPKIVTFAEQNNPLMMTPAQYIEDTHAAMDQNLRRSVWEKTGFRTMKMRYVQPPLERGGEICDYLDMVARMPKGMDSVPVEVATQMLEDFFAKSFPKGTRLSMKALQGTAADLKEAAKDGKIELAPVGKFDALMKDLNVETLSALPPEQQETRIGKLRPDLVEKFAGKGVALDDLMGSYERIKMAVARQAFKDQAGVAFKPAAMTASSHADAVAGRKGGSDSRGR